MAFTHEEWSNIDRRIQELIDASHGPFFTQGTVIKADPKNNIVWLEEFGDQPIPIFTFDYDIKYYDTQPVGNVTSGQPVNTQLAVKKAIITPKCPNVGDVVLIARQHGSRRLPKCLGVLRSTNFVVVSE